MKQILLMIGMVALVGCGKKDLEGKYRNRLGELRGMELTHVLVFEAGGKVGHSTVFSETDLNYGTYTIENDIVTVTISGSFSDKPANFQIESDRLVKKEDGGIWYKVE